MSLVGGADPASLVARRVRPWIARVRSATNGRPAADGVEVATAGTEVATGSSGSAGSGPAAAGPDPALLAQRDRLLERFALMQAELGGLFYEMAIRDHVRLDVLTARAAALQQVDAELAQVELLLGQAGATLGGSCPTCGAPYATGAAFCSQCALPLAGA